MTMLKNHKNQRNNADDSAAILMPSTSADCILFCEYVIVSVNATGYFKISLKECQSHKPRFQQCAAITVQKET